MGLAFSFTASNGKTYDFHAYPKEGQWKAVAGVYAFGVRLVSGAWRPDYVGQTDDFSKRLPSHERWQEARRRGSYEVAATMISSQAERDLVERELIHRIKPPMNDHFKGSSWR